MRITCVLPPLAGNFPTTGGNAGTVMFSYDSFGKLNDICLGLDEWVEEFYIQLALLETRDIPTKNGGG